MDVESEYIESSSITFEWTLKGLKNLFDSTKGEKKSKVTKSIRFGNNRWQILFYANAGQTKDGTEGGYVSLYLSCEPTPEEKEAALSESGRWVREGVYKFTFELRTLSKNILYSSKEAHNHSFTSKTGNWGWAQFARRDSVYYQAMPVKAQDAFVIICTITSSPTTPPVQTLPRQPVPKALLDTVGELLDDPLYSDVQFVLPQRGHSSRNAKTIWASKRLLQRAEYFQTMFNSNFVEGSSESVDINHTPRGTLQELESLASPRMTIMDEFEDSDDDDDTDFIAHSSRSSFVMPDSGMQELSLLVDSGTADSDKFEVENYDDLQPSSSQLIPIQTASKTLSIASKKSRIEVKDVAYTTYLAMLYYIYTDNVVFAPLSSSFLSAPGHTSNPSLESLSSTQIEGSQAPGSKFLLHELSHSRSEWIREWVIANPGRPAPCSAKSMYRIADRLDLSELKERAAQHIIKSLTVDNIAFEIFSPFAAKFESIRKIEVDFFLSHWHDIRTSDAMKNVWVQIRNGRHPGFEEVWPLIAQSLEFNPNPRSVSSSTKSTEYMV
ncbi:hypothetical protein NLJ89_g2872 [Agrocybe chaxingu]|uniref:MATH domain-containing protein n=1 Tax=Agrocybe chaxingu TaxID=84603 RepID=A0A9W8MW19_9AGAR|nr:hypothetical protein NLJ89_g2872 [Agrocybe chaxingu]